MQAALVPEQLRFGINQLDTEAARTDRNAIPELGKLICNKYLKLVSPSSVFYEMKVAFVSPAASEPHRKSIFFLFNELCRCCKCEEEFIRDA